jgi:hypothetical protein
MAKYLELFVEGGLAIALLALVLINSGNVERLFRDTVGGTSMGVITGLQGRSGGY